MASIFGEPQVPKHIDKLKERVKSRDNESAVKLERIYTDYEDRLTQAEKKLQGDLDVHALTAEAAIQELSNRGEDITAAASASASPANEGGAPFPDEVKHAAE